MSCSLSFPAVHSTSSEEKAAKNWEDFERENGWKDRLVQACTEGKGMVD